MTSAIMQSTRTSPDMVFSLVVIAILGLTPCPSTLYRRPTDPSTGQLRADTDLNRRLIKGFLVAALASGATTALAHGIRPPGDTSGIPIPNISHGEMAVLTDYRSEIVALADSVRQPETDFRTLLRYAGIQHANCLWGLVPGSVTDEASPFNECSHADLAAAKALLLAMRDMPQVRDQAQALTSRVDADAARTGAAFIGCQFSGESFNTAEFVRPHWADAVSHMPTLLSLLGLFLGPMALATLASRMARARQSQQVST